MQIIIDSREQDHWLFTGDGITTTPGTLSAGDYSLLGLEHLIAIERKSLPDLVGCITTGRDRFKRELQRLKAYNCRAVIIEADVTQVYAHGYRSQVKPQSVIGSVASWQTRYQVPFVLAGNREHAADYALRIMAYYLQQVRAVCKVEAPLVMPS